VEKRFPDDFMSVLTRRDALVLWLLPIALTAVLFAARAVSLPFWQAFNLDPDYYYLLNGLRIVEGLAPTDVAHPGTPVQMFIAAVIRAMHLFAPTDTVVAAVLDAPEAHLVAVTTVLYPLLGLSLWLLGRAAFAWGGLWPALLAQSGVFLSRIIVKSALHPKPETLLVVAVAALMAAVFATARAPRPQDRHAVWLGIAMGFGIVCKVHFMALGVMPLLLLDRRRFFIYGAVTVAAILVFFSPALPSLDIFLNFWGKVALGAGAYGSGAQTVIDPHRYPRAVAGLFSSKWYFTGGIVLSLLMLAAYFRLRRRGLIEADPLARVLAGILLGQFATVLLVAKQPAPHYMVPAFMLTGPAMAVLWVMSRRIFAATTHRRFWLGLAAVTVVAQGLGMGLQVRELFVWTRDTQALPMERFASCAKVYFDAASSASFAMQRGDMNVLARYSPLLAKRFPADEYTWFIYDHSYWNHGLMRWNRPVELADILSRHSCAVFRGNQWWQFVEVYRDQPGARKFDDICDVGEERLYTVGITCGGQPVSSLAK
jgi:hypothetical protein